jgi:antitoxin MazE
MTKIATITVQKWGNSLAVRIPITMARSVHFDLGTPVELVVKEGGIIVRPSGERKMTLSERLNMFNPKKHGGEVLVSEPTGLEKL